MTVFLLPLYTVLNTYCYSTLNFFKVCYTIQWTWYYFLLFPFFKESTGFSGCFIAFIIKKLLSLIKKNETKSRGKKQLSFVKPKKKTCITLLLLTNKDNIMPSVWEILCNTISKAGIWRLSCACFATSTKIFLNKEKRRQKVFCQINQLLRTLPAAQPQLTQALSSLSLPKSCFCSASQHCTFPSALHCWCWNSYRNSVPFRPLQLIINKKKEEWQTS